ncbi:MAG: YwaF family protein [Clostridiales bacterium]|nr:YwaF family protein [Clostridiales bacterium]
MKREIRILFACGLILLGCEIYKQLFLYFILFDRQYDWWYFPFQLCSLPMYLCLILPFVHRNTVRRVICTFIQDFGILGGIAAILVPDGFRHLHWSLTLHGYAWHLILILAGLFICRTGLSDPGLKGWLRTLPLFAVCCLAATAINVLAPDQADMFYISPFHDSVQPVVRQLTPILGRLPAHLLYLAAICAGSGIIHGLASIFHFYSKTPIQR